MAYARLMEADLYTLEEVAANPRAEVAAIKGVGQVTMRQLDDAMSARGLSFADAEEEN
jgi:hypothetical protein